MESSKGSAFDTTLRQNGQGDRAGTKGVQRGSRHRIIFPFSKSIPAIGIHYPVDGECTEQSFLHRLKHSSVRSRIASRKAVQDVDHSAILPHNSEFKELVVKGDSLEQAG